MPEGPCPRCGFTLAPGDTACPKCRLSAKPRPGSFGHIVRADPLMAGAMGLLVLEVIHGLATGSPIGILFPGAVVLGVWTLRSYGFWGAIIFSALDLLFTLFAPGPLAVRTAIFAIVPLFTAVVLWLRRDYFR